MKNCIAQNVECRKHHDQNLDLEVVWVALQCLHLGCLFCDRAICLKAAGEHWELLMSVFICSSSLLPPAAERTGLHILFGKCSMYHLFSFHLALKLSVIIPKHLGHRSRDDEAVWPCVWLMNNRSVQNSTRSFKHAVWNAQKTLASDTVGWMNNMAQFPMFWFGKKNCEKKSEACSTAVSKKHTNSCTCF